METKLQNAYVHRDVLLYCSADSLSIGLAKELLFTVYVLSFGAAQFLHTKFYQHTKGPLKYNTDHISLLYCNNCYVLPVRGSSGCIMYTRPTKGSHTVWCSKHDIPMKVISCNEKVKVKQSHYRPGQGPEGSRRQRIPDFKTISTLR